MSELPVVTSFSDRHPILKQAIADARQLTWQQLGVPLGTTVSAFFLQLWNDSSEGHLESLAFGKTALYSLLLGVLVYVLVAVVRAPFVVIGEQHRQLKELDTKLVGLEPRPSVHSAAARIAIGDSAFVRSNTKVVELEPNIVALKSEAYIAHNDEDGVIVEGEIAYARRDIWWHDNHFLALTIPYRNRLLDEKEIGEIDDISAQITYRFIEGNRWPFEMPHAAWLSEEESYVHFTRDATHRLIVLTLENGDDNQRPKVFGVVRDTFGSRKGVETRREPLEGSTLGIHVSLRSESKGRVIKTSDFMFEMTPEQEPPFVLESTTTWQRDKLAFFGTKGTELRERLLAGEAEETLEPIFQEWQAEVVRFLELHLGSEFKKRFSPAPYKPPANAKPPWNRLLSPEPQSFDDRVKAKVEALQRFGKELRRPTV